MPTNKEDTNIAIVDNLSYSDIVSMDQKVHYSDSDLDLFLQLSPMQQRGLMLYISGKSIRELCRILEMAESTFYIWLGSELFEKCLNNWQKKIRLDADNKIKNVINKALEKLELILDNPDNFSNQHYLKAIELSLNLIGKK